MPHNATVLDIACGSGRHLQWFADQGHAVTGIDRDVSAAQELTSPVSLVQADIENQPWPLLHDGKPQQFDAVVVTNYLWRPNFSALLANIAPGGFLLYETFAAGNESVGRPARPEFLLQPGELLKLCEGLRIVAYEDGYLDEPARFVQRIVARREPSLVAEVFRARLDASV